MGTGKNLNMALYTNFSVKYVYYKIPPNTMKEITNFSSPRFEPVLFFSLHFQIQQNIKD